MQRRQSNVMLITLISLVFATAIMIVPVSAQEQSPFSRLDGAPYDPEVHPDIDLFISHWTESPNRHAHGNLLIKDIFTPLAGEPLRPERRGAVLTDLVAVSYAWLDARLSTTPDKLEDIQYILFIVSGAGTITAGNDTHPLYDGVGVILPPDLTFTMTNTGTDPLGMYIVTEPIPSGFTPNTALKIIDSNTVPIRTSTTHWSHIGRRMFSDFDGLSVIQGLGPQLFSPMTMSQPHSHAAGGEEIWIALRGDIQALIGKQVRDFIPGSAYKIPADGRTPHANINVSDEPIRMFWIQVQPPPSEQVPYSSLDPRRFDPETDHDPDLYIGSWQESMPRKSHGGLIERDILSKGDTLDPPGRGRVLQYVNRFCFATLGSGESTMPTSLDGEQEIFYVAEGRGSVTAGNTTADLYPGVAVLIPAGLPFTMTAESGGTLEMYLVAEPVPSGFRPNDDILVVDTNTTDWNAGNPHWIGCSKPIFNTASGLGTLENVLVVQLDAMTFFHPHSHVSGCEEVWTTVSGDAHMLLGKQIRSQPPGTGYLIPPDGNTPHSNFNVSDDRIKLFYFARYRDHDVRP
jgi:mannose-6-phosphate isomerase-like protein (cupin superfamily)